MATGATTSAELDKIQPTYLGPARQTMRDLGVMKGLFDVSPLPPGKGPSVGLPKYGTLTAYAGSETTDLANAQKWSDSSVVITPGFVAVEVFLTDRVVRQASEPVMAQLGEAMAAAIEVKRDTDLIALMDGFSTIVPSSGSTSAILPGHIFAAIARITGNATEPGMDAGPLYAAMHPYMWHDLASNLGALSSGSVTYPVPEGLSGQILRNYRPEGRLLGLDGLFLDSNITIATTGKGGVWAKKACVYVPHINIRHEKDRNITFGGGAWLVVVSSWYGSGEVTDSHGVELDGDASAPTA